MRDLNVTLIQSDLYWQSAVQNCEHFEAVMAPFAAQTDLIVLPEMFNSGFSMQPATVAQRDDGETVQWLKTQAALLDTAICGSLAIKTEAGYANRFVFVTPQREISHYDKRHLFRMSNEHEYYEAGQAREIIEYRGWRILPQICYDLRFPVWSRNQNDYDLAIYVANWPKPRRNAWRALLQARAIENQCYCIGVNRIGVDGNGLEYAGDSLVVDYLGELVVDQKEGMAFCETTQLSTSKLAAFKEKFPAWMDGDQFTID